MSRINALIPARGGSKGVPKKNIKLLHGHPLIAYSIIACQQSKMIDKVIVSTDDQEIANVALQYGAEVPFLRPSELAGDRSRDEEVIQHYFDSLGGSDIAYVRPTTPLRDPEVIDEEIKRYFHTKILVSTGVRSMHKVPESPHKMFQLDKNGYCCGFFEDFKGENNYTNLPRQVFPAAYQPNGYLDIVKRVTLQDGDAFGETVLPIITDFVLEVDTEYEFELIDYHLATRGHKLLDKLNEAKSKNES